MIAFAVLQLAAVTAAVPVGSSMGQYRDCLSRQVAEASLTQTDEQILENARTACGEDRLSTGLELAAVDVALEAEGREPQQNADIRMGEAEVQITTDLLTTLADRRLKRPRDYARNKRSSRRS